MKPRKGEFVVKGTIITSIKDAIAVSSQIIESAEHDISWLIPPSFAVFAHSFSLTNKIKMFIQKGGRARGVTAISYFDIEEVRAALDTGQDVRHVGQYQEIFMLVNEKKESISMINAGTEDFSLETPIVAYWTDNPTYAEYLLSSFEIAWEQSTDAAKRIGELSEQEPAQA